MLLVMNETYAGTADDSPMPVIPFIARVARALGTVVILPRHLWLSESPPLRPSATMGDFPTSPGPHQARFPPGLFSVLCRESSVPILLGFDRPAFARGTLMWPDFLASRILFRNTFDVSADRASLSIRYVSRRNFPDGLPGASFS